ncbi:MAG: dihydropteroate synthase [Deltaproteobacteria bacterium]|nr:dihydropteroate synthase [Deltaproteobacteria bacterium]
MIVAADNLNVLQPGISEALQTYDPKPIQELARLCEKAGAHYLDINPGYLSTKEEDRMTFMVEAVQEATSLPLILDSPKARILARGLKSCRSKPIINALTLEEHRLQEILPLAAEYQTPLILLLLDRQSLVPATLEEKCAVALELAEKALAAGLSLEQLIFDPVLPHLSWPDAYSQISRGLHLVRLLSAGVLFKEPVKTMAGLSNLRSGQRNVYPLQVEQVCFTMLAGAGLHLILANVLQPDFRGLARVIERLE